MTPLLRLAHHFKMPGLIVPSFLLAYMFAMVVASWKRSRFRCPHCGSRFYYWGPFVRNGFARKCGNCELRKWQCYQMPHERSDYKEPVPGGIVIRPRH